MNAVTVIFLHRPIFGPACSHGVWPVAISEKSTEVWLDRLQLGLTWLAPSLVYLNTILVPERSLRTKNMKL